MLPAGNDIGPNCKTGLVALRVATLNARDESASDRQVRDGTASLQDSSQQQRRSSGQRSTPRKDHMQIEAPSTITPPPPSIQSIATNIEDEVSEPSLLMLHRDMREDDVDAKGQHAPLAKKRVSLHQWHEAVKVIDNGAASYGGSHFERVADGTMVPVGITIRQQAEPLSPWSRLFVKSRDLFEEPCKDCSAKIGSSSHECSSSARSRMKPEQNHESMTRRCNEAVAMLPGSLGGVLDSHEDQYRCSHSRANSWPTAADMAMLVSTVDTIIASHGDELRRIVEVMDPHSSFNDEELLRHGFTSDLSYIQGLHSAGWMELIAEVEDAIRDWRGMFTRTERNKKVRFLSLDEEEELARACSDKHSPKWRPRRAPTGFIAAKGHLEGPQISEDSDSCGSELK